MNIGIIEKNKVVNIAVFDDFETAKKIYPEAILIDADTTPCAIGWKYDPDTGGLVPPNTGFGFLLRKNTQQI